jgi:pimeloyl-ACP methyl ester carboxylesterase
VRLSPPTDPFSLPLAFRYIMKTGRLQLDRDDPDRHSGPIYPTEKGNLNAMIDESIFKHHTIRIGELRLHYVVAGSGDPVVLLHGWPQTWFEWRRIIPALATKYTVIAPDMRGLGDSSKPPGGYDKRTVADDIYQLVRKLGFERIYLVGHDWGGPTAYAYAAAHPADVRKLAILDVSIPNEAWEKFPMLRRGGIWHLTFHGVRDMRQPRTPDPALCRRRRTAKCELGAMQRARTRTMLSTAARSRTALVESISATKRAKSDPRRSSATKRRTRSAESNPRAPLLPSHHFSGGSDFARNIRTHACKTPGLGRG